MGDFKDNILAKLAPTFINAAEKGVDFIKKVGESFAKTGIVESFGAVLDSAVMILDPLGQLITVVLPALEIALKPVASLLALIADFADAAIAVFTLDFRKFNTALGLNARYGELSHQQQIHYKDPLSSNVYDPTIGAWVGNGSTTINNYNMTVDAKNVRELNDMVNIARNQRVATRMGVS